MRRHLTKTSLLKKQGRRGNSVKIEKSKRSATICVSDGWRLDVNLFLRQVAEEHSGRELILDILNSKAGFIPLEDFQENEILIVNKSKIMWVELKKRDLTEETMLAPEIPVEVKLTNGEILTGSLFLEMPPERSRLSDCLNFSPQFLYLCREKGDIILNKAYVFSVKEKIKKAEQEGS